MNVIQSAVKVDTKKGGSSETKEEPEWRDHKVKLSYLKNEEDGTVYPCLCKRFRTEPSFRVYEADERKGGKLVHVKRNIFVAPYELVEIAIGTPRHIWYARLTYKEHNVVRRRATRDDTWSEKDWLDKTLSSIQEPPKNPRMHFYFREKQSRLGMGHDFEFELKEKNNGKIVKYINPAVLKCLPPGHYEGLSEKDRRLEFGRHTVLPTSPQRFLEEIYLINHDRFVRLCKTGKVQALKDFYQLGYVDPKAFTVTAGAGETPESQGWCPLQHAAYSGMTKVVKWLLEEIKVPYDARSKDGWTAMHCACLRGHFEIAKILHDRGASIFDETRPDGGGFTPMILMMENKHADMVRYFMGEESKYAEECYTSHGFRPTLIPPDMYNVLKPLPDDIMEEIEEAQQKKIAAIEQRRKEDYYKENPEELRKLVSGKNKGRRGTSSKSPSRASSRQSSRGSSKDKKKKK